MAKAVKGKVGWAAVAAMVVVAAAVAAAVMAASGSADAKATWSTMTQNEFTERESMTISAKPTDSETGENCMQQPSVISSVGGTVIARQTDAWDPGAAHSGDHPMYHTRYQEYVGDTFVSYWDLDRVRERITDTMGLYDYFHGDVDKTGFAPTAPHGTLVSAGDRAWSDGDEFAIGLRYPCVGHTDEDGVLRPVGAVLEVTGTYAKGRMPATYYYDTQFYAYTWGTDAKTGMAGPATGEDSSGTSVSGWDFPALQVCDLLYGGCYGWNMDGVEVELSFFYCDGGATVPLNDFDADATYLTFCSQNEDAGSMAKAYCQPGSALHVYADGAYHADAQGESVWLPTNKTTWVKTIKGGNIRVADVGAFTVAYPVEGGDSRHVSWVDELGEPTYNLSATMFHQRGTSYDIALADYGGYDNRYGEGSLNPYGTGCTGWFSFCSAALTSSEPDPPSKDCDSDFISSTAEQQTWTVEQRAGTLGETAIVRWKSFTMTDTLPEGLDFVSGSWRMYQVVDGRATDVSTSLGSFSQSGRTLAYTFKTKDDAVTIPMRGETYRMTFRTTANSGAFKVDEVTNKVTVRIGDHTGTAEHEVEVAALGDVAVSKRDADLGATPQGDCTLKGAVFGLYNVSGKTMRKASGGTVREWPSVADKAAFDRDWAAAAEAGDLSAFKEKYKASLVATSGATDSAGEVTVKDVPTGRYAVVELEAPTGYRRSADTSGPEVSAGKN